MVGRSVSWRDAFIHKAPTSRSDRQTDSPIADWRSSWLVPPLSVLMTTITAELTMQAASQRDSARPTRRPYSKTTTAIVKPAGAGGGASGRDERHHHYWREAGPPTDQATN